MTGELVQTFVDRRAEQRLLGAFILGREVDGVQKWHFAGADHRVIFDGLQRLHQDGTYVDLETLEASLSIMKPESYGGFAYLTQLVATGDLAGYAMWKDRVIDLGVRRAHVLEQQKAIKRLMDGDDPDSVRADLNRRLENYTVAQQSATAPDLSAQLDDILDRYGKPVEVWGMTSGIFSIDQEFGGIHRGEELVIAGEPGAGKSMFVTQLGYQLAGLKFWNEHFKLVDAHPGNIYSLEISESQILNRLIAAQARLEWKRLKTGKYEDETDIARVTAAVERIGRAPVYISDSTTWTTATLRADLVKHIKERGIEWAIIDYMGLLKDRADTKHEQETKVSIALHDIARDLDLALICVDALNKASMDKRVAGIAAVRGSGQKIYDADVVAFLERPNTKSSAPSSRVLRYTKVREGDSMLSIPLTLNGAEKRFDPA